MRWRWTHQLGSATGIGLMVIAYLSPDHKWGSVNISARLGRHTWEVSGAYDR